jgi:hypothetical protein
VRGKAIMALARIGPPAKAALPWLLSHFAEEKNDLHRIMILTAMSHIAPSDSKVKQLVLAGLKDKVGPVRATAVAAIALSLKTPLMDPSPSNGKQGVVKQLAAATWCTWQICDYLVWQQKVVPYLVAAALDEDDDVCTMAFRVLPETQHLKLFSQAVKHRNPRVRCVVIERKLSMFAKLDKVLPALTEALQDEVPMVRLEAIKALGRLGPAAGPASAALKTIQSTGDPEERAEATQALKKILH